LAAFSVVVETQELAILSLQNEVASLNDLDGANKDFSNSK
jgi:hypothetical protein